MGSRPRTGDHWTNSFSSVPPFQSCFETQSIRVLRYALRNCGKLSQLITVYGKGGVGKTTACRILESYTQVKQIFQDGFSWIEFGKNSTADTDIQQLVHVTQLSGAIGTAASISEAPAKRLEQTKSYFESWFENCAVLFIMDNTWLSDDSTFKKWVAAIRGVPDSYSVVLHSNHSPLGEMNVAFAQLGDEEQSAIF
jgi:NB-ARC domain